MRGEGPQGEGRRPDDVELAHGAPVARIKRVVCVVTQGNVFSQIGCVLSGAEGDLVARSEIGIGVQMCIERLVSTSVVWFFARCNGADAAFLGGDAIDE